MKSDKYYGWQFYLLWVLMLFSACLGQEEKKKTETAEIPSAEPEYNDEGIYYVGPDTTVLINPAKTDLYVTPVTNIAEGRNVIYSAALQLAWDEMKHQFGKLSVKGGFDQKNLQYLNDEEIEGDLEKESYIAAHGYPSVVLPQIEKELKEKFGRELSSFDIPNGDNFLLFGYLEKNFKFEHPFTSSSIYFRKKDKVQAVIAEEKSQLEQCDILHYSFDNKDGFSQGDFIVRINALEDEHELILAKVKPEVTLLQTLTKVLKKGEGHEEKTGNQNFYFPQKGTEVSFIQFPKLNFEIETEIPGLGGALLEGPDIVLGATLNVVKMKLDEKGAWVQAYAVAADTTAAGPVEEVIRIPPLIIDQPFLLYMKRKDSSKTYLLMWIDNKEILIPKK